MQSQSANAAFIKNQPESTWGKILSGATPEKINARMNDCLLYTSPDELTVLLLDLQAGSNFHGYILAVGVVDEVFERDDKGIRLRIAGQAVVSVVDRDKADAELREYLFQIPTAVDVVSRKAAEVFDHDAVNRAFADCVFELFEVWTIEGNTAITIVNERLTDNFQIVMPCNVVLANGSLACNGVAFNLSLIHI